MTVTVTDSHSAWSLILNIITLSERCATKRLQLNLSITELIRLGRMTVAGKWQSI